MATNGDGTTQQLDQLEAAITGVGARLKQPLQEAVEELAVNLLRLAEAQAERKRAAGRYALEHGQYLHDICEAHAQQSLGSEQKFAETLLAAEERKTAELRRILGKIAG